MNSKLSPKKIALVATVICAVFFYAFSNSFLSNAETVSQNIKIGGEIHQSDDGAIRSEAPDGQSFVKFQNGRTLKTSELAGAAATQGVDLAQAQAISAATDDFNADGYPDLVIGGAAPDGGFLLIYYGDEEAFSPSNPKVLRGIAENLDFPVPFKTTTFIKLPNAPDFLFAGDFDRRGGKDILTAARGGEVLNLTVNDGGNFAAVQQIDAGGAVSTLAAGRRNLTDDFADVFVGTSDGRVLIYENTDSIAAQTPLVQNLSAPAERIVPGNLDEDGATDLAIVAGGQLFISHGDDALLRRDGGYLDPRAGRIEAVNLPFAVNNLTLGEFVWDREARTEIAATSADGAIRVLTRGTLDTRRFTESEIREKRLLLQEIRSGKRSAESVANRPQEVSNWSINEEIAGDASSALLLGARSSALPNDDLLILNAASRQITVTNEGKTYDFSADSEPVAAIPMRLNVMQPPGLVVLRKGQIEPTLVMIAPQATFTVTTASDVSDPTPDGTNNSGSLREAIQEANGNGTGADLITFNAGINPTLTITSGGNAENSAATGDLDINGSVTITGNSPTTISTAYNNTCGDCKLFGVNQTGGFSSLAVSFSGVTLQNGFNNGAGFSGSFFETGGAIDFFFDGAGTSYSMSNSTVTGSTATGSTLSHGGGINVDGAFQQTPAGASAGTITLTSVTVTNNTSQNFGGGISLLADKHDATLTNPVVTGNTAQNQDGGGIKIQHSFGGTISISGVGGLVQNNSGAQGGGISNTGNNIANINDITVNNNTATGVGGGFSIGGGFAIFQLGALNVAGGTTLTGVNITNNRADNDAGGGGGVAFGQNYTTTITNCTITGNTALQGNGGGVLNQGSNGNPVNVLSISGGVIRGNSATGNGSTTGFGGGFAAIGTGTAPPSNSQTVLNNVAIGGATAGQGNSAVDGGAIANMNTSVTTVSGTSTIFGNTASSRGGGIFTGVIGVGPATGNTVTINNNVPIGGTSAGQGNSAPNGGGVYLNAGTFNYTATSGNNIAGNSATTSGGGLFNNGGTANLSALIITGNTATNGSAIQAAGGTTTLSGTHTVNGNINIAGGSLVAATGSTTNLTGNFSESSGTFTGNNSVFNLTGNFSQSGGTFNANSSTFNLSGNFTYTAGTFSAGSGTFNFNAALPQTVSGTVTFNNLTITNASGVTLSSNETVNGTLTLTAGVLSIGTTTLTLNSTVSFTGGSISSAATGTVIYNQSSAGQAVAPGSYGNLTFSNFNKTLPAVNINIAGTFTPGTAVGHTVTGNTITFNGTALQGIPVFGYNNLALNNAAGANLGGSVTVGGTLNLQAGTLGVGTNTLTLNGQVSSSGGTFSSAATGTVIYNQPSNGQTVLAANYGNLTFNNFNKVLPTATIGIAGVFTPGTAVGHTVTNSNINFNGTSAQTIPVFPYFGLTLANAAGASLGGSVTVNGPLGLAAGVLNVGTNTLTLNGATAQTGGSFSSTATGTVIYNQGSDGQNVLSGTYGNLSFSNFNKVLPAANINILGTFSPGTATGHTTTGNTLTFNGTSAVSLPVFPYNNLVLNNAAGATLPAGTTTIGGTLTLTSGTLAVGANTLIINGNASATGGSLTSAATGTVNYNQPSNGQTVLAANYGNLTFSNFNKVLPAATIGIAGTFTAGTAVGHTVAGNTIIFNGASAQTIPAFTFNNLTLNNAAGAAMSGAVTVGGGLTLTAGTLAVGANTLTLNGAVTVTGGSLSAASGTVVYNQGSNGQAVLATNYGNLSFSNFTKVLPAGTVGIAGVFTPGSAVGHTITGNTISFNGAGAQTVPAFTYNNLTTATGGVKTTSGAVNAASATVGAGTTLIVASGSTLTVTGTLTNNGTIQGLGTIVNNFTNAGTLSPGLSPGILNFTGNFTNSATVNVEIGGTGGAGVNPNGHDQVLISGTATLGGTLNVTFTNGFTPVPGNSFVILDAASLTGTFPTVNLPDISPNRWNVSYNNAAGTVTLFVLVPSASTVFVEGRVLASDGNPIARARVTVTDSNGAARTVQTNQFGSYRVDGLTAGGTYIVSVAAKAYTFEPRVVSVADDVSDLDFIGEDAP